MVQEPGGCLGNLTPLGHAPANRDAWQKEKV